MFMYMFYAYVYEDTFFLKTTVKHWDLKTIVRK